MSKPARPAGPGTYDFYRLVFFLSKLGLQILLFYDIAAIYNRCVQAYIIATLSLCLASKRFLDNELKIKIVRRRRLLFIKSDYNIV
jgi:hypothetical protein